MNKIVRLVIALFLLSCANSNKEPSDNLDAILENKVMEYEKEFDSFTLENLAVKRLEDYFELLKLKKEHPEFQEDIPEQLKDYSENGFSKMDSLNNFSFENVRKIGENIIVSDSVQKMKLYFDIRSENQIKTDSVIALITTKKIFLDGANAKSTKIKFAAVD